VNSHHIDEMRWDLDALNAELDKQCSQIRASFDSMRRDLNKRENEMLGAVTEYRNRCKGIVERNVAKMEKALAKASVTNIRNGNKRKKGDKRYAVNKQGKVVSMGKSKRKVLLATSPKDTAVTGSSSISWDVNPTDDPLKDKKKTGGKVSKGRMFIPNPGREVQSDEWSESETDW